MPNKATIHEIAQWLKTRDDFAIFGHITPDGDTIGCCIATALMLEKMGKRAFVVLPGGRPGRYQNFECKIGRASCRERV